MKHAFAIIHGFAFLAAVVIFEVVTKPWELVDDMRALFLTEGKPL